MIYERWLPERCSLVAFMTVRPQARLTPKPAPGWLSLCLRTAHILCRHLVTAWAGLKTGFHLWPNKPVALDVSAYMLADLLKKTPVLVKSLEQKKTHIFLSRQNLLPRVSFSHNTLEHGNLLAGMRSRIGGNWEKHNIETANGVCELVLLVFNSTIKHVYGTAMKFLHRFITQLAQS